MREALRRYEIEILEQRSRVAAIRTAIREGRADMAHGDYTLIEIPEDETRLYDELTGRQPRKRKQSHPGRG